MKPVIITIDTESHIGKDPIGRLIWGNTVDGNQYGIPLIIDLCDKVGAKGLFFVDMAEAWDYGEDKISEVIKYIIGRGHDVGVHIHPDHMADRKKQFLSEYSAEEQYDIIKRCTDLYKKITGKAPVAFRAGKYGANRETLNILSGLGYKADFSEYYGHDNWCHIQPPVTDNKTVRLHNDLIEFPVMSYENYVRGLFHRFDKLDINRSSFEHRYILKKIQNQTDINVVTLFAHSFSLMKWRNNPDNPQKDKKEIRHLEKALNQVHDSKELEFTTLDNLLLLDYPPNKESNELSVFKVTGVIALLLYFQKAYRTVLSWIQIWLREKRYKKYE